MTQAMNYQPVWLTFLEMGCFVGSVFVINVLLDRYRVWRSKHVR